MAKLVLSDFNEPLLLRRNSVLTNPRFVYILSLVSRSMNVAVMNTWSRECVVVSLTILITFMIVCYFI